MYARYQVSSPAALSVRYERLDDEGLFGGIDQFLHEVTATAEYKFAEGFLLRGEFRRDWSNRDFFTTDVPVSCVTTRTPPRSAWCGGSATSQAPGRRFTC